LTKRATLGTIEQNQFIDRKFCDVSIDAQAFKLLDQRGRHVPFHLGAAAFLFPALL
jgi:hypothetical protein